MLKNLEISELAQVVNIHESSWDKNELSVKLGSGILQSFYPYVIESPYSFAYVYMENGKVIGYATGFYNYLEFNKAFRNKIAISFLFTMVGRLLTRKIGWADIINLLNDGKKFRNSIYPKFHLGALGLANEYKGTETGKKAINEAIGAVLKKLELKGCPGCSVSCGSKNVPMRKYLLKLGFEEIDVIQFIDKTVLLYEKTFKR
jgi:hypothetical protein